VRVGIGGRFLAVQRIDFRACPRDRHAGAEPRDRHNTVMYMVVKDALIKRVRQPEIHRLHDLKRFGQHADDSELVIIQCDFAPDDRRVGAKAFVPVVIGHERD
jgi:hypothetical protein